MKKAGKFLALSFLGLFLISLISTGVFAATADEIATTTQSTVTGAGKIISAIFTPLFGEKEMMTRIFLSLLLFMLVYAIISQFFSSNSWLQYGISIAVTLLAMVALPAGLLEAIRTQYGAMGAAILTIIPWLVILWFSLKVNNLMFGRLVWVFYIIYYAVLMGYNAYTSTNDGGTSFHILGIVLGIIALIVLKPIRNWIFKGELEAKEEKALKGIKFREKTREVLNEEGESILGVKK